MPVVVGPKGIESAFCDILAIVVGERRGRQNINLFETAVVQCLGSGNGRTGLTRAETVIQKEAAIRCSAAQLITDELLVIEEFALFGIATLTGVTVNLFGYGLALCLDSFNVVFYTIGFINSTVGFGGSRCLLQKAL